MNAKQKAALIALLGEEEFTKRMLEVDGVNGDVAKRKLIFRSTEAEAPAEDKNVAGNAPVAETPADAVQAESGPEAEAGATVELDDDAITQIATQVADMPAIAGVITALTEKLTTFMQQFEALKLELGTVTRSADDISKRLKVVEEAEGITQTILKNDTPRRKSNVVRMTYRPSQQRAAVPDEEVDEIEVLDTAAVASATLATLPQIGF